MLESVFLSSDDKLITQPSCRHHTVCRYWGRGACVVPADFFSRAYSSVALLDSCFRWRCLTIFSIAWSDVRGMVWYWQNPLFHTMLSTPSTDFLYSFCALSGFQAWGPLSDAKQIKPSEWCRATCDVVDLFEVGGSVGARQQWQQLTGTKFLICVWNP